MYLKENPNFNIEQFEKEPKKKLRMESKDNPSLPKPKERRKRVQNVKERRLDVRGDEKSPSKPSFLNLGLKESENRKER